MSEQETKIEPVQETVPETEPPKRKRGRPRKEAPDIESVKIESENTAPKRKPYKKRGLDKAETIAGLAKQVFGIHQIIAATTGLHELAIAEDEAQLLASSIVRVADEYGLSLSGKTGAALQLLGAAAFIYVPRVLAINKKIESNNEAELPAN